MSASIDPHVETAEAADRPFQFGLRTLLLFVGALAVVSAIITRVGAAWSTALVLGLLLIAAHVSANAWGTRAASRATRSPVRLDDGEQRAAADAGPPLFAPHTQLGERRRLGWPLPLCVAAGGLAGGTLGTAMLAALYFHVGGLAAVVTGGLSAAIVGGFLAFLASAFLGVAARALTEASRGPRRAGPPEATALRPPETTGP